MSGPMSRIESNGIVYTSFRGFLQVGTDAQTEDGYGNGAVLKTKVEGDLVIPRSVDGKKVVSISGFAFRMCTLIASVRIEAELVSIRHAAFYSCVKMTSINIPATVSLIEGYTFSFLGLIQPSVVYFEKGDRQLLLHSYCFEFAANATLVYCRSTLPTFNEFVFYEAGSISVLSEKSGIDFCGFLTRSVAYCFSAAKKGTVCGGQNPRVLYLAASLLLALG